MRARALFEQALEIDPNDAEAMRASLTYYHVSISSDGAIPGPITTQNTRPVQTVRSRLDPDYVDLYDKSITWPVAPPDEALGVADAGLAVNPNIPWLFAARALPEIAWAVSNEAKSDMQQAIRLSPRDPLMTFFHTISRRRRNWRGSSRSCDWEYRKALDAGDHTFLGLCKPGRRLRALGQDGRGEAVRRRNPSSQSQFHRQMVSKPHRLCHSEAGRRFPQGWVCRRMKANCVVNSLATRPATTTRRRVPLSSPETSALRARTTDPPELLPWLQAYSRSIWIVGFVRTPVLPSAAPVGTLSAQLRRPRPLSPTSAKRRSRTVAGWTEPGNIPPS